MGAETVTIEDTGKKYVAGNNDRKDRIDTDSGGDKDFISNNVSTANGGDEFSRFILYRASLQETPEGSLHGSRLRVSRLGRNAILRNNQPDFGQFHPGVAGTNRFSDTPHSVDVSKN